MCKDENRTRDREAGAIVYPAYSRRSGGLSIGVNLFPDKKTCTFDCPYCEVFPFAENIVFREEIMEREIGALITKMSGKEIAVKDICFSGSGEPTLSYNFEEALCRAAVLREKLAPDAGLVLITNGTGLLDTATFDFLAYAVHHFGLRIWLKLDAGTEAWYGRINRSPVSFSSLKNVIRDFVCGAPVTLQTMLCGVNGEEPSAREKDAWEELVLGLADSAYSPASKGGINAIQLYGKARPAPDDPAAERLPLEFLEARAVSLRTALEAAREKAPHIPFIPVEVYP